jgi:hypothetical protein
MRSSSSLRQLWIHRSVIVHAGHLDPGEHDLDASVGGHRVERPVLAVPIADEEAGAAVSTCGLALGTSSARRSDAGVTAEID